MPRSACPIPAWWRPPGSGSTCAASSSSLIPGAGWAEAAGDLLSGVDAVLVRPPGRARLTAARHLSARARDRQAALVVLVEGPGRWPVGGDLALSVGEVEWEGVGRGHGDLRGRRAEVRVSGRRAAGRAASARSGSRPVRERWRRPSTRRRRRRGWRRGRRTPARKRAGGGLSEGGGEDVERLVVIWCPDLLEEGARGEEARRFARVLARAGELCPWVHAVRLGVCALPARGPARFFGGEAAVVSRLVAAAVGEEATTGVADGLFAAMLAAREGLIVPPGGTTDFLAPWSVATLARPDLAVTLQRLGITTLGQFAALPAANVSDRFGADAAACHAVARGESGELAGLRDQGHRTAAPGGPGRGPRPGGRPPPPIQPGFFGGASEADRRAARSFVKVQERLGVEAVLMGRVQGGRTRPDARCWCPGAVPRPTPARPARPWPGQLPPPAPTDVLRAPPRAELIDAEGNAMVVSGRGLLTAPVDRLSVGGGPWAQVVGLGRSLAGDRALVVGAPAPGPAPGRHGGRGGPPACTERGQWWVEALYD